VTRWTASRRLDHGSCEAGFTSHVVSCDFRLRDRSRRTVNGATRWTASRCLITAVRHGQRRTTPRDMTKRVRPSDAVSLRGSPATAMISGAMFGAIVPTESAIPNARAVQKRQKPRRHDSRRSQRHAGRRTPSGRGYLTTDKRFAADLHRARRTGPAKTERHRRAVIHNHDAQHIVGRIVHLGGA
jgi:hypothetical protein